MSKENKCNKCNRNPSELTKGQDPNNWQWAEYHISSEKLNLNPKNSSNKELLIKVFDIKLCEDCYEQEKSKYLNDKKEYSISLESFSNGGVIRSWQTLHHQKNSTKISLEWLENFKKTNNLQSIHYKEKGTPRFDIEIIDKDGNKVEEDLGNDKSVWGELNWPLHRAFNKGIWEFGVKDLEEYLKENNIVSNDNNIERERERERDKFLNYELKYNSWRI